MSSIDEVLSLDIMGGESPAELMGALDEVMQHMDLMSAIDEATTHIDLMGAIDEAHEHISMMQVKEASGYTTPACFAAGLVLAAGASVVFFKKQSFKNDDSYESLLN